MKNYLKEEYYNNMNNLKNLNLIFLKILDDNND